MNVRELIQRVCKRNLLPIPNAAVGSPDAQTMQMVELLNEFSDDLITRKAFTLNVKEATFVSTGAVDCGVIETLAPGWIGMIPETLWDRSRNLRLWNPISATGWQRNRSASGLDPFSRHRIVRGHLFIDPAPAVGSTIAFEYYSSYIFRDGSPTPGPDRQYAAKDTDYFTLNDALPLAWLNWRWKSAKGLDYAEDFVKYEHLLASLLVKQGDAGVIDLAGPRACNVLEVPSGSWMR